MFKKLWRKIGPNPLDRLLKKAQANGHKKILIPWNRGLGDIALGLYAIVHRIKTYIPDAEITFITRKDLEEGFALLEGVKVVIDATWKRKESIRLPEDLSSYDLVIENADPTYWVAWQRGTLVPELKWNPAWDELWKKFDLPEKCIGAHVQCETNYYQERDWPIQQWNALFSTLSDPILLLGMKPEPLFSQKNVIDLRGKFQLFELLSILKNRCRALIAPDSGILSMIYFLNTSFPIKVVSLWADPHHGVLKQNVPSPNPQLVHIPIISSNQKNAALISTDEVLQAL
jgi:ADP-heptose:LPS heptosyltransferase